MAIDNRLQVFNEEGQSVDYDILASDVKFMPDGKDLPTKLAEMEQGIEDAGSGDGTVTGVKMNNGSPIEPDGNGVVDLGTVITQHQDISGKVDKDPNKELIPSTDLAKLQNLPTADQLTQQIGQKANDNAVVKSISVNNVAQQKDGNGNVNLQVQAGEQVSVIQPDPADGTFIIRVGSTDYTINLNHTHLNMCELVVCEESDLPSTLEASTIYAVKNGDETGIETVYFGGLPFTASAPQQLPYDAEVEYLQSTGTQYIGTGVQMQSTFKCEIKAQFDQNNDGFDTLVGALEGSANYGVVLGLKNSNGGGSIYSQIGGDGSLADCAATPLALHVFTTQLMNGTISIDADGVSGTHAFSGSLPTNSLFLFARNRATVGNFCNAKIYYCKIWNGGALVRNFIPVRVGQVGYMYDKVSKQLFENIGTGNFTLGNDKQ